MTRALTPRQRNERWAKNNTKMLEILNMEVGEHKILDENEVHRRTISIVERFAFPNRKYKHKRYSKEQSHLYFLVRVS